jgi:hypothetical protein
MSTATPIATAPALSGKALRTTQSEARALAVAALTIGATALAAYDALLLTLAVR